jgi:phage terminase large subunit-like protein
VALSNAERQRLYRQRRAATPARNGASAPSKPAPRTPKTRDAQPFTVKHFRQWARRLELDNGNQWDTEDFQEAFLDDLFAGIPECWLIIPEGNAKTTLFSGIGLYHIEHRRSAMVPIAASARDQAQIMYAQGDGFLARALSGDIASRRWAQGFKLHPGYRRIRHERMMSLIQFQAADDRTGDGVIPTLGLVDELHRHRDLALYRTWRGKLEKRGGQIGAISTRGEPGTEFELTLDRIRREATDLQRSGSFLRAASSRLALHEWSVPEEGDVEDLDLVKSANPLKAITVPMLREKRASPTMTLAHWRRFVCNLPTRSDDAAITEAEWYAAKTDDVIPEGTPIMVGLDVAWKFDTTSLTPFWAPDKEHRLLGPATVLVPPRDGTMLDGRKIETAFTELHARTPVEIVVMDMSRAEQLAAWLSSQLGALVIDWPQGNATAAHDFERFMEALRNGWLKHSGDEGLTTHALNAIAKTLPYGDAKFERPVQGRLGADQERRVIDALKAASMVNSYAAAAFDKPAETPKSRKVVFA